MYFNREFLQAISNSSIDPTVDLEAQATVVYVMDSGAADQRDFGESEAEGADPDDLRKRLWDMCGHFLIIQVPYHVVACPVKAHTAQSIVELKCMVDQVLRLHSKGFVQGDLRPLNYVGTWIDFDISGKCGIVTFPALFQRYLPDIYRLGKGRAFIRPYHDIHSLAIIVLDKHNFSPPSGLSEEEETGVNNEIFKLTKEFKSLASFERRGTVVTQDEEESKLAPLVARLPNLLEALKGWECLASEELLNAIEDAEGEKASGSPIAK
jgi:hypothetical protein